MYAHVTTHRLGTSEETEREIDRAAESGDPINDQAARTIASYWHSPATTCRNITALSHGVPFDTEELREELAREVTQDRDAEALTNWLDSLELTLSDERPQCEECDESREIGATHGLCDSCLHHARRSGAFD